MSSLTILREFKLDKVSALFAASIYQSGAFFASQAEHLGAIEIAAWLPLVYLGILRASPVILSAALAMSVLGGFTPLTVIVFLSAGIFLLAGSAPIQNIRNLARLFSPAVRRDCLSCGPTPRAERQPFPHGLDGHRWRPSYCEPGDLVFPNAFHILEPGAFTDRATSLCLHLLRHSRLGAGADRTVPFSDAPSC